MFLSTVKKSSFVLLLVLSIASFGQEKHLKNIKQLTFGGDNAEAYFSPKGDKLTLQVTNKAFGVSCDQIFITFYTLQPMRQIMRVLHRQNLLMGNIYGQFILNLIFILLI